MGLSGRFVLCCPFGPWPRLGGIPPTASLVFGLSLRFPGTVFGTSRKIWLFLEFMGSVGLVILRALLLLCSWRRRCACHTGLLIPPQHIREGLGLPHGIGI